MVGSLCLHMSLNCSSRSTHVPSMYRASCLLFQKCDMNPPPLSPDGGGVRRRMEEQNRKGSFDAKALYVSYQVDKTMGHSVL